MIENGRDELTKEKYVQTENELEKQQEFFEENRQFLFTLLDRLAKENKRNK